MKPPGDPVLEMPESFWQAEFTVRWWPKKEDVTATTAEWNVGLEKSA
jgi:hypothetical protein